MSLSRIIPAGPGSALSSLAALVLLCGVPAALAADRVPAAMTLPSGPAKAGFDLSRANFSLYGAFDPFVVTDTTPLRDARSRHLVADDTDVLVTDTPEGKLALLVEQMAYHHIAQGGALQHAWMVSFCVVCNTGSRLVPVVQGKSARFETAGVYNGLLVMQDATTGSIWDHITGEALYGPAVGQTLGPLGNVLQMTVKQALASAPDARVAISDRIYFAGGRRHGSVEGLSLLGRAHGRPADGGGLSDVFVATLGREDLRRPRMELGLGIWSAAGGRYYPRDSIRRHGDALIDRVDGRPLLVYLDPVTSTPAALYVDATAATVKGSAVRLSNGQSVRDGVLYDAKGHRVAVERPQQVFTRWYGFALTFPGTAIYDQR